MSTRWLEHDGIALLALVCGISTVMLLALSI